MGACQSMTAEEKAAAKASKEVEKVHELELEYRRRIRRNQKNNWILVSLRELLYIYGD